MSARARTAVSFPRSACDDPERLAKAERHVQRYCLLRLLGTRSEACALAAGRQLSGHDPLPVASPKAAKDYVAIFRAPSARLASPRGAPALAPTICGAARSQKGPVSLCRSLVKHARAVGYVPGGMKRKAGAYARENASLAAFGRRPELLGCATRMLNGAHCVSPLSVDARDVALAVKRVSELRFVGLTEDWVASVCLFHRVVGLPQPKRAQARNTRDNARGAGGPGPGPGGGGDATEAAAPRDSADAAVYAAAATRFAALLERHGAAASCVAAARDRASQHQGAPPP